MQRVAVDIQRSYTGSQLHERALSAQLSQKESIWSAMETSAFNSPLARRKSQAGNEKGRLTRFLKCFVIERNQGAIFLKWEFTDQSLNHTSPILFSAPDPQCENPAGWPSTSLICQLHRLRMRRGLQGIIEAYSFNDTDTGLGEVSRIESALAQGDLQDGNNTSGEEGVHCLAGK